MFIVSSFDPGQEHNQALVLDYIDQAMKLGYTWSVDVDELRIKYVELLYFNNLFT